MKNTNEKRQNDESGLIQCADWYQDESDLQTLQVCPITCISLS